MSARPSSRGLTLRDRPPRAWVDPSGRRAPHRWTEEGAMRVSARRVPSIAVALAALLALAGPPRPAAATSQETYVPLDAFGLDAGGEPRVSVFVSGQFQ